MGSWFTKPQKLTTTQNASTSALQPYAGRYQDLLDRSWDVSQTAYNPATNAGVADFSDPQRQAFGLAQNAVGAYQPYLAAATGAASMGAAPSYINVGQYMNPFDQYVTGSLMNDYDQMINRNRQMTMSDAAKAGALTGDRRYVAQSIGQEGLDRTLASNLANVRQQGYSQALGAAQADALRQLQATGVLSNLGGLAQQYGFNDVNAMLGVGGLQQAQQQRELDTATQNALRQSAYPFETAQWATNQATQLGGAAGSSSTGKTVAPGPSWGQQIIGAMAAAAGAAAGAGAKSDARIKDDIEEIGSTHDGQPIYRYRLEGSPKHEIGLLAQNVEKTHPEAVSSLGGIKHVNYKTATEDSVRGKYALGGGMPYGGGGLSYIPQIQMQPIKLGAPQFVAPAKLDNGMEKILNNFTNAYGSVSKNRKPTSSWTNPDTGKVTDYYEPTNLGKFGDWLGGQASNAWGGLSSLANDAYNNASNYLGGLFSQPSPYYHGGVVRRGYQFGGLTGSDPFENFAMDDDGEDDEDFSNPSYDESSVPIVLGSSVVPRSAPSSKNKPATRIVTTPPVPPDSEPADTGSANYTMPPSNGLGGLTANTPSDEEGGSLFGFKMSPEAANALMTAGLGMMASPSPFIGQAIGEGGLAGMRYYMLANKEKDEQATELRKAMLAHAAANERNRIAQLKVNAADRGNDLREKQINTLMPYRNIQIQNLESLMKTREGKQRLYESLGLIPSTAAPETIEPPSTVRPMSSVKEDEAKLQLVSDAPEETTTPPTAPSSKEDNLVGLPNGKRVPPKDAIEYAQRMSVLPEMKVWAQSIIDEAKTKMGTKVSETAQTAIDKKLLDLDDQYVNAMNVVNTFDEKYLNAPFMAKQYYNSLKDKWLKDSLSDEEKKELGQYTKFRASSAKQLNDYINAMAGTAVSMAEANRMKVAMANAGGAGISGIFESDGPQEFKMKMNNTLETLSLARLRYHYMKKNGFPKLDDPDAIANQMSLEDMKSLFEAKKQELGQKIVRENPKITPSSAAYKALMKDGIRKEFGIGI